MEAGDRVRALFNKRLVGTIERESFKGFFVRWDRRDGKPMKGIYNCLASDLEPEVISTSQATNTKE